MKPIDKAIKIMNSLSGYERFVFTDEHDFIVDTKLKALLHDGDFIHLMISEIYNIYQNKDVEK